MRLLEIAILFAAFVLVMALHPAPDPNFRVMLGHSCFAGNCP
jgi:hypothetical protein